MIILNDLHLGVTRSGGTTPQSQTALRDYLRTCLVLCLEDHAGQHVVINGDLFDSFQVETSEVIAAHKIFSRHLEREGRLTLIMGNHDASAKGDKVSSFHLLAHILESTDPDSVDVVDHTRGFSFIGDGVFAISHCMNQALFDLELAKAAKHEGEGRHLLLHCNYKNGFAENSDHSLNINDEQVGALMRAGWTLVLGHEHQGYTLRGGRVIVVGNQFPSSVADCIGDPEKHLLVIDGGHEFVCTWDAPNSYIEADWRNLADIENYQYNFIRVVGNATALEAAAVIKAVSQLRQRSDAYVITNSVKVEGQDMTMNTESIESIKAFDVLSAIYSELNEREIETVKELMK